VTRDRPGAPEEVAMPIAQPDALPGRSATGVSELTLPALAPAQPGFVICARPVLSTTGIRVESRNVIARVPATSGIRRERAV
jgi:hypothetical protein